MGHQLLQVSLAEYPWGSSSFPTCAKRHRAGRIPCNQSVVTFRAPGSRAFRHPCSNKKSDRILSNDAATSWARWQPQYQANPDGIQPSEVWYSSPRADLELRFWGVSQRLPMADDHRCVHCEDMLASSIGTKSYDMYIRPCTKWNSKVDGPTKHPQLTAGRISHYVQALRRAADSARRGRIQVAPGPAPAAPSIPTSLGISQRKLLGLEHTPWETCTCGERITARSLREWRYLC